MALLHDDDVGIFVSTGGFTKDAQELARSQERRKLPIQPIYFLAPED